jgi:hypothetical protein
MTLSMSVSLVNPGNGVSSPLVGNLCGAMESSKMPNPRYAAYEPAAPYFDLVRGAVGDLVDGEHFFDIVSDDVVYEVLYEVADEVTESVAIAYCESAS